AALRPASWIARFSLFELGVLGGLAVPNLVASHAHELPPERPIPATKNYWSGHRRDRARTLSPNRPARGIVAVYRPTYPTLGGAGTYGVGVLAFGRPRRLAEGWWATYCRMPK